MTTTSDTGIVEMNIRQEIQVDAAEQKAAFAPEKSKNVFSIGEWSVIPELNRLQHRNLDQKIQLEPRLVNLLCYLASNQDRVIGREELIQELWPRVIVNENSLTRAVSELRKQLRSTDTELNYIETIPKKGYRLLVPVEDTQEYPVKLHKLMQQASQTVEDSDISPAGFLKQKSHTSFQAAAAAVAIAATLVLYPFSDTSKPDDTRQWIDSTALPLLSDQVINPDNDYMGGELSLSGMGEASFGSSIGGTTSNPIIANDNNQYAYIKYDHSGSTIYLGSLNSTMDPLAIYSNDSHLFNLAWSPVGNNLLFAKKPGMSTAAIFSNGTKKVDELFSLDLGSMLISKLIPDASPAINDSVNKQSLT